METYPAIFQFAEMGYAFGYASHASGKYNKEKGGFLFSVGWGVSLYNGEFYHLTLSAFYKLQNTYNEMYKAEGTYHYNFIGFSLGIMFYK